MPHINHGRVFESDSISVFDALLSALAKRRWAPQRVGDEVPLPKRGCCYRWQTPTALRTGRVLEVRRPLLLTLDETLDDPPCCVGLRLRWRLDALTDGSQLRLDLRYSLNAAATVRQGHWRARLERHCLRMYEFVAIEIRLREEAARASCERRYGIGS